MKKILIIMTLLLLSFSLVACDKFNNNNNNNDKNDDTNDNDNNGNDNNGNENDNNDDIDEDEFLIVTFNLTIPENTPIDDHVYLVGELDLISDLFPYWDPEGMEQLKFTRNNNELSLVLEIEPIYDGVTVEYKYTRGDATWTNVEKQLDGDEVPNRSFVVSDGLVIEDEVVKWADSDSFNDDPVVEEGTVTITFNITLPENTPEGDISMGANIYNWQAGQPGSFATRDGNTATFQLTYDASELPITLQYKWTRGSWDNVEKGKNGEELSNRVISIKNNQTINDKVESWADVGSSNQNNTVVGNLDIVKVGNRNIRVWTPESYNANDSKKYPVIYLHDGQNVFDRYTSFAGEWEADEAMVSLMDAGFAGAIIVGVDNSSARMGEYVYNHSFLDGAQGATKTGDQYMNYLVEQVIPYVNSNYNTLTGREHTTIGGSSLGGLISLFGGLEHLNTFGNIIAFSSSTQLVNNQNQLENYFNNLDNLAKSTKFFFYVGNNGDGNANWPSQYKNLLVAAGIDSDNIETFVGNGYGHNEPAWAKHLPQALKWLFNLD